jgi:predicted nucleic acid-binding protein
VQSNESDWQRARELREAYVQKRCTLSCPEFLALELANALMTGRKFTAADINVIAEAFRALDIVLETVRWSTLEKAVDLASSFNTAVYDSYFLALAIESSSILVTADDLFVRKVGKHPNLTPLRQLRPPD